VEVLVRDERGGIPPARQSQMFSYFGSSVVPLGEPRQVLLQLDGVGSGGVRFFWLLVLGACC
jgi:hypothetical protein